jgi:hypothetical protein
MTGLYLTQRELREMVVDIEKTLGEARVRAAARVDQVAFEKRVAEAVSEQMELQKRQAPPPPPPTVNVGAPNVNVNLTKHAKQVPMRKMVTSRRDPVTGDLIADITEHAQETIDGEVI